ncbi:HET-domain-containing protein, partial [Clathrospora elynae]
MRLLDISSGGDFSFTKDLIGDDEVPPYAILSHTWQEDQEVTFDDLMNDTGNDKAGYKKIRFCAQQAKRDGLHYVWVDTCCINKANFVELQDAINSMFRWYRDATKCYVFLSDVSIAKRRASSGLCAFTWEPAFRDSRWFNRGWTLQELLAPRVVSFFSWEGEHLGDKHELKQQIHEITGIPVKALAGALLSNFSVDERLSWSEKRDTSRKEDKAYSLLGMFSIYMLPNYGEGQEHAFRRLRKAIRGSTNDNALSLDEKQNCMLLDSLRFDQIDTRQMSIRNAHASTCKWLLHKSEYLDWLDETKLSEHHGFLWIKGKPGTGKSTLMKFAVANARKMMKGRTVLSFFFNARGEDMEKSTMGTYQSLLLQLLERLPALQSVFESLGLSASTVSTEYQWNVESLKMLLTQTVQNLTGYSVVCFIDALDECQEQQIRDMVSFFEHVSKLAVSSGIRFQVCFSSRHYPHITIQRGLNLVLEGQEGHTQDIANYLASELKIGQSSSAQQIRSDLQDKASGVFMWVVLVVNILNKEHDRGRMHALRRRLKEIPGDLHDLFRDLLTRDSRNKDELVLCIQWVLFAKQPLSSQQLYFAVLSGVEPETLSGWDRAEITPDVVRRFILDSSKGLAEVTTSKLQRVQFIHESVRDFLLKENGLGKIWPELDGNLQGQSHERLKQCCLTYMNVEFSTRITIPKTLPKASSTQAASLRKDVAEAFPFLEYAVHHILYHANAAERSGITQTKFLNSFPLLQWIKLHNLFEKHEVRRHTERATFMYILAELNLANLISVHPSVSLCLEVEDERYGCPLFAAIAAGSEEAAQVCMKGIEADQVTERYPCELNSQISEQKPARHAFRRKLNFSKKRGIFWSAVELGNEGLVLDLLNSGKFEADLTKPKGESALCWAVQNGWETVVKLLLDKGADVNAQGGRYGNALQAASGRG